MDLRQLDKNVDRAVKNKIAKELNLTRKKIYEDIEKSVEIQNRGQSTDAYYQSIDPKNWQRRKNFINSVLGQQTTRQLGINPMMKDVSPDLVSGIYRTFAFDRLQSAIKTTGDVVIPFGPTSYYSLRDNLMPQSPKFNRNGELIYESKEQKASRIPSKQGVPIDQQAAVQAQEGVAQRQGQGQEGLALPKESTEAANAHFAKFADPKTNRILKENMEAYGSEPYAIGNKFGLPVYAAGKQYIPAKAIYEDIFSGSIHKNFTIDGEPYSVMIANDGSLHFSAGKSLGKTGKGAFRTMNALVPHVKELLEIHSKVQPNTVYSARGNDTKKFGLFRRYLSRLGENVSGDTFTYTAKFDVSSKDIRYMPQGKPKATPGISESYRRTGKEYRNPALARSISLAISGQSQERDQNK
jgi:hypothetical protein